MTRWVPAAVVVLGVLALAWSGLAVGKPSGLVAALAGLGIVWWVSPADDETAAWVRSVCEADETVPTVRIGERVHTNPDPEIVRAALH